MDRVKTFCRNHGVLALALLHFFGLFAILVLNPDFAAFSSVNLLITFAIIGFAHQGESINFWRFFILTYLIGYGVELLGTQTGFPFGNYKYGNNLAPLLFDVPWIIGVNWFVLAMAAAHATKPLLANEWLRVPAAALVMVATDYFIEQAAPALDYWHWQDQKVPLINYLGWLVVALWVQFLWTVFLKNSKNTVAHFYLWIVLAFFIILILAI